MDQDQLDQELPADEAALPVPEPAGPQQNGQHLASALLALVAGAGLVAGAVASPVALLCAVAALQAALIGAWVRSTALPGRSGAVLLGVAAAVAADVAVMVWPHGELGTLVGVLAFVQIAAFVHQLARGVARVEIVTSLGQTELLLIAVIALAGLVQLRHLNDGRDLAVAVILAAGAALVEGHLIDLAWTGPRFDAEVKRGLLAAATSVVVSGAITYAWLDHAQLLDHRHAIILGVSVGVLTSLFAVAAAFVVQNLGAAPSPGRPLSSEQPRRSRWLGWPRSFGAPSRPLVAVLLPLALLAPVGYVLASAVQG